MRKKTAPLLGCTVYSKVNGALGLLFVSTANQLVKSQDFSKAILFPTEMPAISRVI